VTLGAAMLAGLDPSVLVRLRPLHGEMLLVGWLIQLAFGVGYWILPRFEGRQPRGSEAAAWVAMLLLNAGLLAAGLGQMAGTGSWALAGRMGEAMAAAIFAVHVWSRVGRRSGAELRSP
jgi:hypothetical protein